MPNDSSPHEGLKFVEGLGNVVDAVKNGGQWKVHRGRLLPAPYTRQADVYLCGAAILHVHFGWRRGILGKMEPYCLTILNERRRPKRMWLSNRMVADRAGVCKIPDAKTKNNEFMMLIQIVQATEQTEWVPEGLSPVVVGLHPYDNCLSTRLDSLDGGLELLSAITVLDHEVSVGILGPEVEQADRKLGVAAAVTRDKSPHDVIEGATQVVYEVSQDKGNLWVRLLSDSKPKHDLSLVIWQPDSHELVRVNVGIPLGGLFEVYHVLLSSLDLETPGVRHDVYSSYERRTETAHTNDAILQYRGVFDG